MRHTWVNGTAAFNREVSFVQRLCMHKDCMLGPIDALCSEVMIHKSIAIMFGQKWKYVPQQPQLDPLKSLHVLLHCGTSM